MRNLTNIIFLTTGILKYLLANPFARAHNLLEKEEHQTVNRPGN